MARDWLGMARRALGKPPVYIVGRIAGEIATQLERYRMPRRVRRFNADALLRKVRQETIDGWWSALAQAPLVAEGFRIGDELPLLPTDRARILERAESAHLGCVDLLGSGPLELGAEIDWLKDYKSGFRWPPQYCHDIDYCNPERPSDVKFPWELSRLQWLLPLAQAYVLDRDERHARRARQVLEHWIASNPCAGTVNWSCTMEVALRIVCWVVLFQTFCRSDAWSDHRFREQFLRCLYLHAVFTRRNLERSDVNGNHYAADACGLVFAGLFFRGAPEAQNWLDCGWSILKEEILLQVHSDGVDFEASVPYHRLVAELFLFPAIYLDKFGYSLPATYRERLLGMARFVEAYSRADGSVPLWGDADDARALPFGVQDINDHRYLLALIGTQLEDAGLRRACSGSYCEAVWWFGKSVVGTLPQRELRDDAVASVAFPQGGFYVLRDARNHVFIDCGPLGLAGRGGHGHNDLLSFEAVLDGVNLVSDCGAYCYTADYAERNRFRSTAYHNTPRIDSEEINRFVRWDYLWSFHNDAVSLCLAQELSTRLSRLVGQHSGFQRLPGAVTVRREFQLDHQAGALTIKDEFSGEGVHSVEVPIHLAPEVSLVSEGHGWVVVKARGRTFEIRWNEVGDWNFCVGEGRISPSYGRVERCVLLKWERIGNLCPLTLRISPDSLASVALTGAQG